MNIGPLVGDLKRALEHADDYAPIYFQVVAQDGVAWSMFASLGPVIGAKPDAWVLTLGHPTLATLRDAGSAPPALQEKE